MSEFTTTVASTDPIDEATVSHRGKRRPLKVAAVLAAAGIALAACGSNEPAVSAETTSPAPTTSAESTTSALAPTTTETAPPTTTAETTPSTSATAEISTQETLCDKAAALGVTKRLGAASCTAVTTKGYFGTARDSAQWQSSQGEIRAEVFDWQPIASSKFAVLKDFGAHNIQPEQRPDGLKGFNTVCNADACYAPDLDDQNYAGAQTLYEAAGGTQAENLATLDALVNAK